MKSIKTVEGAKPPKKNGRLKSIHEELYRDGKSVDEIIKKYPQLKKWLEPARKTIEEQRESAEWLYSSGVIEKMDDYRKGLVKIADGLQPAIKILNEAGRSNKFVEEVGPLKAMVEVTPTIISVSVSIQGLRSELEKLISSKKELLLSSLITPESQTALNVVEIKKMLVDKNFEKPSTESSVINLVLHSDDYLCVKGTPKKEKCYLFRTPNGQRPKRLKILEIYAKNKQGKFSSKQLAELAGYGKAKTAGDEFKHLFQRIADKLGYDVGTLYDSDNNGYSVKCSIEIADDPTS